MRRARGYSGARRACSNRSWRSPGPLATIPSIHRDSCTQGCGRGDTGRDLLNCAIEVLLDAGPPGVCPGGLVFTMRQAHFAPRSSSDTWYSTFRSTSITTLLHRHGGGGLQWLQRRREHRRVKLPALPMPDGTKFLAPDALEGPRGGKASHVGKSFLIRIEIVCDRANNW